MDEPPVPDGMNDKQTDPPPVTDPNESNEPSTADPIPGDNDFNDSMPPGH